MVRPVRVAILFIDGVGVGRDDASINPLAGQPWLLSQFDSGAGVALPAGGRRFDVDATFGIAGRPQSASSQTAIYTGMPAPQLVGRHVMGFPTPDLVALLNEKGLAARAARAGQRFELINGYPVVYLEALGLPHTGGPAEDFALAPRFRRHLKPAAATRLVAGAGLKLKTSHDVVGGRALSHDIDGAHAQKRMPRIPRRSSEEAAAIFWSAAGDISLFDHSLADEAGHAQDFGAAREALATFDAFAREVIRLRPRDAVVVICSDHGNVEDLSVRHHTLNRVPVLCFGDERATFDTVADVGLRTLEWSGLVP